MKPLKLRKQSGMDKLISQLVSEREIEADGNVKLHGFQWDDAANVLATFFEHDDAEELEELERIIFKAFFSPELAADFTVDSLILECERVRREYAKRKRFKFTVLSGLTAYHGIDFSDFSRQNVRVSFDVSEELLREHSRLVDEHFSKAEAANGLFRLVPYTATVYSVNATQAFEDARKAVDVWRGAVNLAKNLSKFGRTSSGRARQPLNEFVNAKFSTVFDEALAIEEGLVFYFSDWEGPQSAMLNGTDPAHLKKRMDRFTTYLNTEHGLSEFVQELLVKYVRACDSPNWHYSFLELWTILEQACCIQPGQTHEIIVNRVSSLYKDKDETNLYLNHLRLRRNSIIHKGYEQKNQTSERMLFQLNRYVSQVLFVMLANKLHVKNKREWENFLDLGDSAEALQSKRRLLNLAIAFRRGHLNS